MDVVTWSPDIALKNGSTGNPPLVTLLSGTGPRLSVKDTIVPFPLLFVNTVL